MPRRNRSLSSHEIRRFERSTGIEFQTGVSRLIKRNFYVDGIVPSVTDVKQNTSCLGGVRRPGTGLLLQRRTKMHTRQIPMLFTAMFMIFGTLFYSNAYSMTLFYSNASSATELLSSDEEEDLLFMREEEKLARDTYLTFYEKWGLSVFSNIASSEQMHMNAILKLLKKYKLPDPAAGNEIGEFTNETLQDLYLDLIETGMVSVLEALKVGGLIEEKDMYDIQLAIDRSQKADIDAVYESLLCGSRNHLRSFAQNIEALTDDPYVAQILQQDEVDAILASPMERCGKKAPPVECKGKCLGWMK